MYANDNKDPSVEDVIHTHITPIANNELSPSLDLNVTKKLQRESKTQQESISQKQCNSDTHITKLGHFLLQMPHSRRLTPETLLSLFSVILNSRRSFFVDNKFHWFAVFQGHGRGWLLSFNINIFD